MTARRRAGFTLIEILVTLVVLVIGIFALLRLFPAGFLTIQRTGEITGAQALAQQQLDEQKNLVSVPQAIVPGYFGGPGNGGLPSLVIDPTVQPDDLTDFADNALPYNPVAAGTTGYDLSNINRIRTVIGETVRIPTLSPNTATGKYGSVYMLQLGPVYNQFAATSQGNYDLINVHGAPMERTQQVAQAQLGQIDPNLILTSDAQYAIDVDKQWIAFYPRVAASLPVGQRTFSITYDFYQKDATGNVTVRTAAIGPATTLVVPDLPPGTQPVLIWMPIFNTDGNHPNSAALPVPAAQFIGMVRNSEEVSRKFNLLSGNAFQGSAATPTWSSDPYEYAWYSPQIPGQGNNPTNANPGVLLFNPAGHAYVEQTVTGPQPLTARIDYTVFDNHILREDRIVPTGAPYDIKLSLGNILTDGDTLPDGTTYAGMFRSGTTPDLMIYNANTGEEIGEYNNGQATIVPNSGMIHFGLNAKDGIVRLNANDAAALQSLPLRFFYRAQREWGMQLQKATSVYKEIDPNVYAQTPALAYNQFLVGGQVQGVGSPTRLYFPLCDSGKTVTIGKLWVLVNSGNGSQAQEMDNQQFQISNGQTQAVNGTNLAYVDVSSVNPNIVGFSSAQTGQAATDVMGISLKSRVIWRDVNRWRKVDNDTFLPAVQ